jgi:hypothetical protein
MTDALVEINDRLANAARAKGSATATFFCECGDCLALEVPLPLDEHEELRVREDLIFAPGHEVPRRHHPPTGITSRSDGSSRDQDAVDSAEWRELLMTSLLRVAARS